MDHLGKGSRQAALFSCAIAVAHAFNHKETKMLMGLMEYVSDI